MSDSSPAPLKVPAKSRPRIKFILEVGDDYGRNILISSLKNMQPLRGEFNPARFQNRKTVEGKPMPGKPPFIAGISGVPPIPGMRLVVDVQAGEVTVLDPLADDPDLLARIEELLRNGLRINSDSKLGAMKPQTIELNDDEMKTLLLELYDHLHTGSAKIVKGQFPESKEDIEEQMPGRELFDVRSSLNRKPKYKDELDAWERGLERAAAVLGSH